MFDSPTTRGVYDSKTGFYWASDSFATPMLTPVRTVAGFDRDFYFGGVATFAQYISPWLTMVDEAKFQASVDRIVDGFDVPSEKFRCLRRTVRTDRQRPKPIRVMVDRPPQPGRDRECGARGGIPHHQYTNGT